MAAVLLYVCSAFVVWMCSAFFPLVQAVAGCESLGSNVDCSKAGRLHIPTDLAESAEWVTRLELQINQIAEIRNDDLKGLTQLKYLDLSKNSLTVINGSVFRDLINLEVLILNTNQLTEIPLFPKPMRIVSLSMVKNHIVRIPLENMERMPHLESFDLSSNILLSITNGSFPKNSRLRYLNLNGNRISGIDQGCLNNLTVLETLKLNRNKLTDLPQAAFSQLAQLKTLELVKNDLRMIVGLTFQGLKGLNTLKLKRNRISVLKDGAFYGLRSISSLYLDNNKIANITKAWLFGLGTLKQLSLSHNHISSIEREAWESFPNLEKLDLDHNRLTAITDKSLAKLSSLKLLSMDHNQVARIDERAFQDLGKLSVLQLNDNEISWTMEDVSGAFRGLDSLTRLGLRSNGIRSVAVPAFSGLPRLRQLNMEDNDFMSIQENAFETLRGLRELRFNSSKLYCDCHLAWLPSWLIDNGFQHSAIGTCFHPLPLRGDSIYQLDVKKLTCNDSQLPKPVILESPKSANGFKGQNLTLSCVIAITGKGTPNIHWKKDRMLLSDSNTEVRAESDGEVKRFTSYLHLVDIKDSMAGKYQCLVSNDFGSTFSQRAYINVYVYPVFIKRPKDVTVKAGKPAELKCAATGQPTPVISWQKDGGDNFPAAMERRMQVYPNDDRFYILNTRSADEGVYSCMASNDAGQVTANATVTVLETPEFVKPMQRKKRTRLGETSVLQCLASGSPTPKLTWLKDNKELEVTSRHKFTTDSQLLVIMDTKWSDSGVYACRMSNSLGTAKGSTELQVLSASGDSSSSGGSSGLDDESTTTGIIIIAVVCCVVGTSLVWVIIIYQTRKRHEVYSNTPTDETTLPGEVQSSGYMSSDKEGSYSQGLVATPGYYYQDYQMKESGYESSSGQYRTNGGYPRPMAAFVNDDDDEPSAPLVTAGDKLLQQMQQCSASSLHYPASDGDTIGSRHSTSSGQHSGSSNPPSSHSGQSTNQQQLHIVTNPLPPLASDLYPHHPPTPSPSPNEGGAYSGHHGSKTRLSPSPDQRPVLQTFHPTKPTNHDRLVRNGPHDHWERREDYACDGDHGDRKYSRPRHYSDSCDKRDADNSPAFIRPPAPSPCPGCLAVQMARVPDVHLYSQIEGRNNSRREALRERARPEPINNGFHRSCDSKGSYYSSLPSSSHSSSPSHKPHTGFHSRVEGPSPSFHMVEPNQTDSAVAGSHVRSDCNNKSILPAATGGHACSHQLPSSNRTNTCLCHGARELAPPHYDEVISHQNRYNCVPSSSSPSNSSHALARSRSSSSVGRDPMYFAYQDRCASPCCGSVSDHNYPSCDDNSPSPVMCSDCENTKKRKSPSSLRNLWQAKPRTCQSPKHSAVASSSATPLLTKSPSQSHSSSVPSAIPSSNVGDHNNTLS